MAQLDPRLLQPGQDVAGAGQIRFSAIDYQDLLGDSRQGSALQQMFQDASRASAAPGENMRHLPLRRGGVFPVLRQDDGEGLRVRQAEGLVERGQYSAPVRTAPTTQAAKNQDVR